MLDWSVLGKRLISEKNEIVYENYPGSFDSFTLPKGKPSGIITGYNQLKDGSFPKVFYQVDDSNYIEQSEAVKVVGKDAKDESGFFSLLVSKSADFLDDSKNVVVKNAGFLKEGFKETSKKGLGELLEGAGFKGLKNSVLLIGGVLTLWLILISIIKLK